MSTTRRTPITLDDLTASMWADREERQRRSWARELGLNPDRVDLLALPPVPPTAMPARRGALQSLSYATLDCGAEREDARQAVSSRCGYCAPAAIAA